MLWENTRMWLIIDQNFKLANFKLGLSWQFHHIFADLQPDLINMCIS